ncbi:MAG: amidase, partial [Hyphomicrobiales bacterium]|nr:amidase [Hyphomicrobiales bacterium]
MSLHDLSAVDLLSAYREKKLSPVEVVRAVLDHIAAWEPHLKATYRLDPEAALAAATRSEARWRHGEPNGALDGV